MEFVQIIEYRTDKPDELLALGSEWEGMERGPTSPTQTLVCRDREDASHFFTIVVFPSYEKAMANSEAPETDAMAKRMSELVAGQPTFHNLDVVDRQDG